MFEHASNKDKANNGKKLSGPKKNFYFCKKKMIENLSDKEIIERLRLYDEKVTREFFYDICHVAYCIDDKKYGLRYKTGMDFYSLAHEYYLRLCNNGWHQLENCKPGVPLANWTMNGFHFLVRERLKAYSKGHLEESIEERASKGKVVFDAPVDDTQKEVREMVEEICHVYYHSDRMSQSILRMILVMGMKGKEVAAMMGVTPAAVSQRYHAMMDKVVRPYFIKYYQFESSGALADMAEMPSMSDATVMPSLPKSSMAEETQVMESRKPRKWFGFRKSEAKEQERHISVPYWLNRVTPHEISNLNSNEVFVFGSDLRGLHCGGTAYLALRSYGAVLGQGVGPQGRSYAIPTIVGGLANIMPYVQDFIHYASAHPQQVFLVTPVGCGIAGFTPEEIAPLFRMAKDVENIFLPREFWEVIA